VPFAGVPRVKRALLLSTASLLALASLSTGPVVAGVPESRPPVRNVADAARADLPAPGTAAFLGIVTAPARRGLQIVRIVGGSASARAGLRRGDVLRSLDGETLEAPSDLDSALESRSPGTKVTLTLVRDGSLTDRSVTLGGRRVPQSIFRSGLFRLAVVPVLFADDSDDDAPSPSAARRFFFKETGRRGVGASLADYFSAQSLGSVRVDGRILAPIRLAHTRSLYAARPMGAVKGSLFVAAATLLRERESAAAMRDVDGIVFLHTGPSETRPGRALWPHRAVVMVGGRRLPYYVHSQQTVAAGEIGEHCHEFAHLLGLDDEYGIGHRTGSGDFCVMGIGHRGGGRTGARSPFSLCAPCRARLGWLPTVVVDPRVVQRLRLPAAHEAGARAVVVPLDARTREYLLLEVRAREDFDTLLPSAGLLVWRIGGLPTPGQGNYGREVDLIEAHGIDTFDASLVRTDEIAFPTRRARDLTPDTVPSSSSARPDAFDVYLTDMERRSDGSVEVTIGVRRTVNQSLPRTGVDETAPTDRIVERVDPITGERVLYEVGRRSSSSSSR